MHSELPSISDAKCNRPRQVGSIIICLLGGLGILIVVVAMAWPTFICGSDSSYVDLAMANVSPYGPLGMQIDIYHTHMKQYPTSLADLTTRPASDASNWQGPYIADPRSLVDPWNLPLRYRYPPQKGKQAYELWSAGRDGINFTDDDVTNYPKGE